MNNVPLEAFKHLMRYIYTGDLKIEDEEVLDTVLGLLQLVNMYGFEELQTAMCSYLRRVTSIQNVCLIFEAALWHHLKELEEYCHGILGEHAAAVIESESFLQLSASALKKILSQDTFCAKEIDIFKAVNRWISVNSMHEEASSLLENIRLHLITLADLTGLVKESGLLDPDRLCAAIEKKRKEQGLSPEYRAVMVAGENIATRDNGATVLAGIGSCENLGSSDAGGRDSGVASRWIHHFIDDGTGIVVRLNAPYFINYISILLPYSSSSFRIEISLNGLGWSRIIDHSDYPCHHKQHLYFDPQVVRYIRVLGTRGTDLEPIIFKIGSFEAAYSENPLRVSRGVSIPRENVASTELGARHHGHIRDARRVLFQERTFTDNGRTVLCRELRDFPITLKLAQPYLVDSMRFVLSDGENMVPYYLKVSVDAEKWTTVATFRSTAGSVVQYLKFEPIEAVFLRIDAEIDPGCWGLDEKSVGMMRYIELEIPAKESDQ